MRTLSSGKIRTKNVEGLAPNFLRRSKVRGFASADFVPDRIAEPGLVIYRHKAGSLKPKLEEFIVHAENNVTATNTHTHTHTVRISPDRRTAALYYFKGRMRSCWLSISNYKRPPYPRELITLAEEISFHPKRLRIFEREFYRSPPYRWLLPTVVLQLRLLTAINTF